MRKLLFSFAIVMIGILSAIAQPVGYSHKAFLPDGCVVNYLVVIQNDSCFIEVNFDSDQSKFTDQPTMMIRTFADEVFKLNGSNPVCVVQSKLVERDGETKVVSGFYSTVRFNIEPSQMEALKNGIAKVRLSTTPYEHEREFKKDKIGKKLYERYLKEKDKDSNF